MVCSINLLVAQDYKQLCTEGETYFKFSTNYLMSFRQDSAIAIAGYSGDTLFWSYPVIMKISGNPNCYDTAYGSVLGRKVLKKSNGWFAFFNWMNDSIWINTQANPGDAWELMKLGDTGYIKAVVTSISIENILDNPDSVKTIMLQAINENGQPLEHLFNGKQIKLSKTYGLTHIYNLTKFPNDSTSLFLAGKTNPPIGYQNITFFDCYDFAVGDEFHIRETSNYNHKMIIKTLLEKFTSVTGDTLTFIWDLCYVDYCQTGPYIDHKVVTEQVSPIAIGFYGLFDMQPNHFFRVNYQCSKYVRRADDYNSRSTKTFESGKYKASGCWVDSDYDLTKSFSEGLGMTYYRNGYWYEVAEHIWVYIIVEKELEYYKKGNETWGTPLAADCWTLTGMDEKEDLHAIKPQLTIYPNPSTAHMVIENSSKGIMSIFNACGLEVIRRELVETNATIDVSGLMNGIYFIKFSGENGYQVGRFIKE